MIKFGTCEVFYFKYFDNNISTKNFQLLDNIVYTLTKEIPFIEIFFFKNMKLDKKKTMGTKKLLTQFGPPQSMILNFKLGFTIYPQNNLETLLYNIRTTV